MDKMLEAVKLALRISVDDYDAEISALIDAARSDLLLSGVTSGDEDARVNLAIAAYVKAHFGYAEDAEKWQRIYDTVAARLSVDDAHREG